MAALKVRHLSQAVRPSELENFRMQALWTHSELRWAKFFLAFCLTWNIIKEIHVH